jgi:5-methylcytosine-specific restriction endonuclease McrA
MKSLVNQYAPCCAMPGCITPVRFHKKYVKKDGSVGANWKTFCEYHRTVGKPAVDRFKASRGGCENRDARLGFVCGDPSTKSLTVDHWDGDKKNNDQNNLVVLCANCHTQKTKLFSDHLKRYNNINSNFGTFFETA